MARRLVVCVFAAVVLLGAASVADPGGAVRDDDAGLLQPQTERGDFENVVFRIEVFENRTARWTVRYIQPLDNESQVDDFEAFATRFNTEELQLYESFRVRAERIVQAGQNVTGRSMTATAFRRDASVVDGDAGFGQTRGVLEMSFRWTDFARAEGRRVVVGDVFEGGLYLGSNQRLVFRRGPDVAFLSVDPPPDSLSEPENLTASSSVTYFGQVQFADQRPFVEFVPRGSVPSGDDTTPNVPAGPDEPGETAGGSLPFVVGGLVVVIALVGGIAWYSGYLGSADEVATDAGGDGAAVTGAADGAGVAAGSAGTAAPTAVPDEELLSDEDRVLNLLDDNGGRMKQVSIVEETDWSKSKVSMLLSDMEEEGQISKLRLGRENIISLAGQEPDAAGSPFEDEDA